MTRFSRIALLVAALLTAGLFFATTPPATAQNGGENESQEKDAGATDRIILRNGRVIEGRILSETQSQVKVMVVVAGIEAPATYEKSEILEIERDFDADADEPNAPAPGRSPIDAAKDGSSKKQNQKSGDPVVYRLPVEGFFVNSIGQVRQAGQRAVLSKTPMRKAINDALSHDPEAIVLEMDAGAPGGLAGVFVAEEIGPIIEDAIQDGVRIVFWIERAEGGAGLLPFTSPDIFFKSGGEMGGLSGIGEHDSGDDVVNEKLISASLGHAEGFAIKGGYDPVLIRAMARREMWLAVRFQGGKPEFITHKPRSSDGEGWIVLSDDGEGDHKDGSALEDNDVLNLDAEWAYRLGVSKETVDNFDDLVYELNIGREYNVVTGKGERILDNWKDEVNRALDRLQRLLRQLEEDDFEGDDRRVIGTKIRLHKQARSLLTRYAEIFDPQGNRRASHSVAIEQLRQEMREAHRR